MEYLDFELPIKDLQEQFDKCALIGEESDVDVTDTCKNLQKKLDKVRVDIYKNLTAWQRVQLSRHPNRPYTMDYINAIASLKESLRHQSYTTSEDFRDLFEQIKSMRLKILGDETALAFFSEQEFYESHQLSLKELSENPGFSDAERQKFLKEIHIKLPIEQREDREQTFLYLTYQKDARKALNGGLGIEELGSFRVQTLGKGAAKRLTSLDQKRKEWERKRLAYIELKTSIEGFVGVAPLEQKIFLENSAIEELDLSASELKRMQALDRINSH